MGLVGWLQLQGAIAGLRTLGGVGVSLMGTLHLGSEDVFFFLGKQLVNW